MRGTRDYFFERALFTRPCCVHFSCFRAAVKVASPDWLLGGGEQLLKKLHATVIYKACYFVDDSMGSY